MSENSLDGKWIELLEKQVQLADDPGASLPIGTESKEPVLRYDGDAVQHEGLRPGKRIQRRFADRKNGGPVDGVQPNAKRVDAGTRRDEKGSDHRGDLYSHIERDAARAKDEKNHPLESTLPDQGLTMEEILDIEEKGKTEAQRLMEEDEAEKNLDGQDEFEEAKRRSGTGRAVFGGESAINEYMMPDPVDVAAEIAKDKAEREFRAGQSRHITGKRVEHVVGEVYDRLPKPRKY